jgi:hypothetical protein
MLECHTFYGPHVTICVYAKKNDIPFAEFGETRKIVSKITCGSVTENFIRAR